MPGTVLDTHEGRHLTCTEAAGSTPRSDHRRMNRALIKEMNHIELDIECSELGNKIHAVHFRGNVVYS